MGSSPSHKGCHRREGAHTNHLKWSQSCYMLVLLFPGEKRLTPAKERPWKLLMSTSYKPEKGTAESAGNQPWETSGSDVSPVAWYSLANIPVLSKHLLFLSPIQPSDSNYSQHLLQCQVQWPVIHILPAFWTRTVSLTSMPTDYSLPVPTFMENTISPVHLFESLNKHNQQGFTKKVKSFRSLG